MKNFFTSLFATLSDPLSYSSFQKELGMGAVSEAFFNVFAGKESFMAVVLPQDVGAADALSSQSGGSKAIRVRPIDVHSFILPEPCSVSDPKTRKKIISMHPVAYPDTTFPIAGGNVEQAVAVSTGMIVECFFQDGPQGGNLRGLVYRKTNSYTNSINLDCLGDVRGKLKENFETGQLALGNSGVDRNGFDRKYETVIFQGSVFPDKPIRTNMNVKANKYIRDEYLPVAEEVFKSDAKGFLLLATAMAIKEGFRPGTRSYKTNNPGNVGNTDSGNNRYLPTLKAGIELQKKYILGVTNGTNRAYPINKKKVIKPKYSGEIAKNQKNYGISPYLPGYEFIYTGQLDQYVKIYATGPRASNSYLSLIISYFKKNGITINAQSKIQDIIKLN